MIEHERRPLDGNRTDIPGSKSLRRATSCCPQSCCCVAEEPRHGYSLAKGVHASQVGRVDRPSVYRALAQLEADGLICSSPEHRSAGQGRRVYSLTEQGEQVLRRWMGVIKQERDGLDRVLRRYVATGTVDAVLAEVEGGWHAVTATPWSAVSSTSRIERGQWLADVSGRQRRPARRADRDGPMATSHDH